MTELAPPCHSPSIGKREIRILKLTAGRPFADLDKAARRLLEHAHAFEPIQDGRIYIEKLNGPFLFGEQGHARGIRGGPRSRNFAGLARNPRFRHLPEVHAGRRRAVRLMADNGWQRKFEDPILL
jgi:hypothetical protein